MSKISCVENAFYLDLRVQRYRLLFYCRKVFVRLFRWLFSLCKTIPFSVQFCSFRPSV